MKKIPKSSLPIGLVIYGRVTITERSRQYVISAREAIGHSNKSAREMNYLRMKARKVLSGIPNRCQVCQYSPYVEVCHIKPISEFPLSALESEINAPNNLVKLCRNCHFEFDNGYMSPENKSKIITA